MEGADEEEVEAAEPVVVMHDGGEHRGVAVRFRADEHRCTEVEMTVVAAHQDLVIRACVDVEETGTVAWLEGRALRRFALDAARRPQAD